MFTTKRERANQKTINADTKERTFSSTKLLQFLVLCTLVLVFISTFLSYLKFQIPFKRENLLNIGLTFFSVDRERNLPTYFSSFILLASSLLLFYIFSFKRKEPSGGQFYWGLLAFIFLGLSLDEFVGFHELTAGPLQDTLDLKGFFYMGWVVPAILLVAALGILFLKFLLSLNKVTRYQFIFSAVLYIGGALVFEMLGGYLMERRGVDNFTYALCTNIEEMLEMSGISFFIYALLNYIRLIAPEGLHMRIIK